jgi:predicted ABC-type ATPase
VAGPAGVGKTTIATHPAVTSLLGVQERIDADTDPAAAERLIETRLAAWHGLLVETRLETTRLLPLVERARERRFLTAMLFVSLPSPAIALVRLRAATRRGGTLPNEAALLAGWHRSHASLAAFVPHLDAFFAFANSGPRGAVLAGRLTANGRIRLYRRGLLPEVAHALAAKQG